MAQMQIATPKASKLAAPQVRRCGLYLRVSKALKRKGKTERDYTSIDAQRDTCLNYIKLQPGWTFAEEYIDDGRSGKNLKRPSVQRMLADIKSGKIDTVVVYKVDRLSRSIRDFSDIMTIFQEHETVFASVTQTFSTENAMGRLIVHILMSFAEFEREMTAERTADKVEATRREGRWAGGPAPFGYDLSHGSLTLNEGEAETVRMIFALYIKLRSAFDVAARLNEAQRPTKLRGPDDAKHAAKTWTKGMVTRVLRNALYIGLIPHEGETFDGLHAPIVDRETFDAARAILDANAIDGERRGRNVNYVLQGVLRCACVTKAGETCGHAMSPGSGGKAGGARYRYYRCVGKEKGRNQCKARPLPADAIEAFVTDRLSEIARAGQVSAELIAFADRLVSTERPALATRAAEYPPRIADISARGAALVQSMMTANAGARSLMERELETLGAELEKSQGELGAFAERIATIDAVSSEARWIVDQLGEMESAWDKVPSETRGRLVRAMVRSVDVNEAANDIAIVFSPLDTGRRALGADDSPAFVSAVRGELYRVHGRAVAFTPDAPPPALVREPVKRPARVASMLALAHHMEAAVKSGKYLDHAALARALGFTRARISQVSSLTMIAPDIQAEILALEAVDGREPLAERALRPVANALVWERQREIWRGVKASAGLVNRPDGAGYQSPRVETGEPAPARPAPLGSASPSDGAKGAAPVESPVKRTPGAAKQSNASPPRKRPRK